MNTPCSILNLYHILKSTRYIYEIPCRFRFFNFKRDSLTCLIEYGQKDIDEEKILNYLIDYKLHPKIKIKKESPLTEANNFSSNKTQFLNIEFHTK